jgi:tRNA(Ile)-lysidine synthase
MLIINSVNFENKMIDIQNKHQIKYSFLIFNILFSKKNILRPLLIFHRNDIIMFSKTYLLPILCDPSNQKIRWSRNRLRHQLFPLLRFFFNPNIESLVNNFLEISVEEQNYIEYLIQKIILYWLKKERNYNDIEKQVQILPKAIQRRLLQKIFQSYTNLQPNLLQIEILRENVDKNQCS